MMNSIRWVLALLALLAAAGAGWNRYQQQVAPQSAAGFESAATGSPIRLLGRIGGGSLHSDTTAMSFVLEIEGRRVPVRYVGPDRDSVRELKTMLVGGVRQPDGSLLADSVGIHPNYGYVAAGFGLVLTVLLLRAASLELQLRRLERENA